MHGLPAAPRPVTLRVRVEAAPSSVSVDGASLPAAASRADLDATDAGWLWDAATRSAWVRFGAGAGERVVTLAGK